MVKISSIIILFLLTNLNLVQTWKYFPEDYSSYFHNTYSDQEYFVASFYPNESNEVIQDLRAGINKYPFSATALLRNDCGSNPITISTIFLFESKEETEWSPLLFITQSPSMFSGMQNYYENVDKYYLSMNALDISSLGDMHPNLKNYQVSNDFLKGENYRINYYLFIAGGEGKKEEITIQCFDNCSLNGIEFDIIHPFYQNSVDLIVFQSYMSTSKKYFSKYSDKGIVCQSNKLVIYNKENIRFNIGEIRMTISLNSLENTICSKGSDCPPGTYCDDLLKQCKKCSGKASICTSKENITKCSRFMKEWLEDNPKTCTPEYLNLNQFDNFYFVMKPIRTNTATLTFWFYLTEVNRQSNSKESIAHIVLSDHFLITILIDDLYNYEIYFTAYHLYHKVYGSNLEDTKKASDFLASIKNKPYSSWFIKESIPLENRWIYGRFAINNHIHKMEMLLISNKGNPISTKTFTFEKSLELPYEYIYSSLLTMSSVPFFKYYREDDVINLNIKNVKSFFENNLQFYIKNLYVFDGYIPGDGSLTNGFQYYNLHNIIQNDLTYPEFVFSCGFDNFNKESDGTYSVSYRHPTSKSNTLNLGKPLNDDSVYEYSNKLYRLYLINEKNKIYDDNLLSVTSINSCYHGELCFSTDRAFSCKDNYYLNPRTMNCDDRCIDGYNIGIMLSTHKKGTCIEMCQGVLCRTVKCSSLSIDDPNYCDPSIFPFVILCKDLTTYFPIFGKCYPKNDDTFYDQSRGALYYSYFFNLPSLTLLLKTTFSSYYFSFWFMLETNTALYPVNSKNYFFLTNAFKLYHNKGQTIFGIEGNNGITSENFSKYLDKYNWNKFTIEVDKNSKNKSKIYINNQFNFPFYFGLSLDLDAIYFCHSDVKCQSAEGLQIKWSGGYYKNIQIFNKDTFPFLSIKLIENFSNYESISNNMSIKLNKPPDYFTSSYITINIPLNFKTFNRNAFIVLNSSINEISLINSNHLNLQQMFNFNDSQDIPVDKRVNHYLKSDYTLSSCDSSKCSSCFGEINETSDKCMTCNPDFHFSNGECNPFSKGNANYWALILPIKFGDRTINMGTTFSNPRQTTISFWLKLFGINNSVANETEIILFQQIIILITKEYKIIFRYTNSNKIIDFVKYDYTRLLGKYVHFSIALRTNEHNDKMTVIYASINREQVEIKEFKPVGNGISLYSLSFGSQVYAFVTKLNYYLNFIVGIYGFNTNKDYILDQSIFNLTRIQIKDDQEDCIDKFGCVKDYDQILDGSFYPSKKQTYIQNDLEIKVIDCHPSCSNYCFGEDENSCSCKSDSFYNFQLFDKNNQIICKKKDYIDLQRHNNILFSGIKCDEMVNPAIEFWLIMHVYEYRYTDSIVNIVWNNLFDIAIEYDLPSTQFKIQCHKGLNSKKAEYEIEVWNKIICQYQRDHLSLLINNKPKAKNSLSKPLCLDQNINFILQYYKEQHLFDFSWGSAFIRQFRVWSDNIDHSLENIEIIDKGYLNSNLKVIIDPIYDQEEKIQIYKPNDNSISYQKKTLEGGYVSFSYDPKPTSYYKTISLCNEDTECIDLIDINKVKSISYDKVLPSVTGRYTMEFWIQITNSKKLSKGLNIIWDNHISISIVKNIDDKSNIICFPQSYRDNPKGIFGDNVIDKASTSLNSHTIIEETNGKWVYIRCAYNWDMEEYYLQFNEQHDLKPIKKEVTYYGATVDFPFKYYQDEQINAMSSLKIELPTTREDVGIVLRIINLYNEYLPFVFSTSRIFFKDWEKLQYHSLGLNFGINENIEIEGFDQNNAFKIELKDLLLTSTDYIVIGGINRCQLTFEYFDKESNTCKMKSLLTCNTPNSKLLFGCDPIECLDNYYLDINKTPFECVSICSNNMIRSPGSNPLSSICNYNCSNKKYLSCGTNADFPNNLKCRNGYTRVGYKCLPLVNQTQTSFYFNRCLNFLPLYTQFDATTKALIAKGYYLELWFKFDHINTFCDSQNKDQYILWAYPHAVYQKANTKETYYINMEITAFTPVLLSTIHNYEWNVITIKHKETTTSVFVNMDFATSALEYENLNAFFIEAIAFCTGTHKCIPLNTQLDIVWTSAYYKKIRLYLTEQLNEDIIQDFISGRISALIEGMLIYYLFNNLNNDLNIVKNLGGNSNSLNFYSSISNDSRYHHTDKFLLYMSSSNNDWGNANKGNYITNIDILTGKITSKPCAKNCLRCHSNSNTDCYECKEGFLLHNKSCQKKQKFHFIIPDDLQNNLTLRFNSLSIKTINPITISLWIKFYGFQSSVQDNIEVNCVLLVKISNIDESYVCLDKQSKDLKFYIKKNTLIHTDKTFKTLVGKWINLSFSNYYAQDNSDSFPFMFSISFNRKILPIDLTLIGDQSPIGILVDQLAFGTLAIFQISNLLIYSSFIHNPFGIITNSFSQSASLIFELTLTGESSSSCIHSNTFDQDITHLNPCILDENSFLEEALKCPSMNMFYDGIQCSNCFNTCITCSGNTSSDCSCSNNEKQFLIKHTNREEVKCEYPPSQDFMPYSKIIFNSVPSAYSTQEYTIDLWLMIYSYNKNAISFFNYEINWSNHLILASFNHNNKLHVKCVPTHKGVNPHQSLTDESMSFFTWNHIICSINLHSNKYYINKLPIEPIYLKGSITQRTTQLTFSSEDNINNNGIVFIRDLKLFSFYKIINLFQKCKYNDKSPQSGLLSFFQFDQRKFADSKGNEASTISIKTNYLGYNIIENYQRANFLLELDDCFTLYVIPSKGFINTTYFLFFTEFKAHDGNYNFYYSLDGNNYYLLSISNDMELIHKFTESEFENKMVIIEIRLLDENNKLRISSTSIDLLSQNKTLANEIDYSKHAQLLNYFPNGNMETKQIINRITVIHSLVYSPDFSNLIQTTQATVQSSKIKITNPECFDDFCSNNGKCSIIVRSLTCICNDGFTGIHCHITRVNEKFFLETNLNYWNLLTDQKDYSSMIITKEKLEATLLMIQSLISFIDCDSSIIQEFFLFINTFLELPSSTQIVNLDFLFKLMNHIYSKHYSDINRIRAVNYSKLTSQDKENVFTPEELTRFSSIGTLLNKEMMFIISKHISIIANDSRIKYSAFDLTIQSINKEFDYQNYFTNYHNDYFPHFDGGKCSNDLFDNSTTQLYFVMVFYIQNPYAYDYLYLNTSSYMIDIFYSNIDGLPIKIQTCKESMSIYLPVNLFNISIVNFIEENAEKLKVSPEDIDKNDPYFTFPTYVHPSGEVSQKSIEERINDRLTSFSIDCSHWNSINSKYVSEGKAKFTESLFFQCDVFDLNQFTTIMNTTELISSTTTNPFFYLYYPQIFKYSSNYLNFSIISMLILLILYIMILIKLACFSFKNLKEDTLLENVKRETILQQRLIYSGYDIEKELEDINKLKINDFLFKLSRNQNTREKTVSFSIKKTKSNEQNSSRRIISDYNTPEQKLGRHSSKNIINFKQSMLSKKKIKKYQKEEFDALPNSSERKPVQISIPKLDNLNNNYANDNDENIIDSELRDNVDISSEDVVEEQPTPQRPHKRLKSQSQDIIVYSLVSPKYFNCKKNQKKTTNTTNMDFNGNEPDIKGNAQSGAFQIKKKLNYISIPKIRYSNSKLFPVSRNQRQNIPITPPPNQIKDFYEHINTKSPSICEFYKHMTLKRNFYITPFYLKSLYIVSLKRFTLLFTFIFFLFFSNTLILTFIDRINESGFNKIMAYSLIGLLISYIALIPIKYLLCLNKKDKQLFFELLKKDEQLQLNQEWKKINTKEKKYLTFAFVLTFFFFFLAIYFSFNLTTVLYWNKNIFPFMIIYSLGVDFLKELLFNLIISIIFRLWQLNKISENRFQFIIEWKNFNCCA